MLRLPPETTKFERLNPAGFYVWASRKFRAAAEVVRRPQAVGAGRDLGFGRIAEPGQKTHWKPAVDALSRAQMRWIRKHLAARAEWEKERQEQARNVASR